MAIIYTHGDFDGIVSAAFVCRGLGLDFVNFTSPANVYGQPVGDEDIVCDLPYPFRKIRYWFDHHESNIREVEEKGIAAEIAGRFFAAPSAAQVISDFFSASAEFPEFFAETLRWANRIDSMDYESVDEWMEPTPSHRIDRSIFLMGEQMAQARRYMRFLVDALSHMPLEEAAKLNEVQERYKQFEVQSARAMQIIERASSFADEGGEILVLDFSEDRFPPKFSKNLAYSVRPNAKAVLLLQPVFQGTTRTNDVRVSLSLNPFMAAKVDQDVASILRELGIGDGHPSAAGGTIESSSKPERLKNKQRFLADVVQFWKSGKSL